MTDPQNDPGPVPELAWLPVNKIRVDRSYQRSIESRASQKLIERIAADFQWCAFQAILACPDEGGGWLVLDGQHRVEAARRSGIQHVPAVVVAGGSVSKQALAFVRANLDRVALNQYALFHARLAAEDEKALAVRRVCAAAGMSIPRNSTPQQRLKPGETLALGGVSALVATRGEVFATALLVMVAKVCAGTHGQIKASLIRACSRIAEDDLDKVEQIGRVLSRTTIVKFFAYCAARRARDQVGEAESIEAELRQRIRALGAQPHSAERAGHPAQAGQATMAKPAASNRAEAGRGERAAVSAPRPAPISQAPTVSAADRASRAAEEERQKRAFEATQGVSRLAKPVETVFDRDSAIAALERLGRTVRRGPTYLTIDGKRVEYRGLVAFTNGLLRAPHMVRVKPGEKVPA